MRRITLARPTDVPYAFSCCCASHRRRASLRAATDVADAAMRGDRAAVRAALARKADVNVAQIDGSTALHWAVERDDLEMADLLIRAGARVDARTREGVDAAAARRDQRQRADARSAAQGRRRSERAAHRGGRHRGDDGGADREDRRDSRARRGRRQRQREGELGRHDGVDVGGVRRACRRRADC